MCRRSKPCGRRDSSSAADPGPGEPRVAGARQPARVQELGGRPQSRHRQVACGCATSSRTIVVSAGGSSRAQRACSAMARALGVATALGVAAAVNFLDRRRGRRPARGSDRALRFGIAHLAQPSAAQPRGCSPANARAHCEDICAEHRHGGGRQRGLPGAGVVAGVHVLAWLSAPSGPAVRGASSCDGACALAELIHSGPAGRTPAPDSEAAVCRREVAPLLRTQIQLR